MSLRFNNVAHVTDDDTRDRLRWDDAVVSIKPQRRRRASAADTPPAETAKTKDKAKNGKTNKSKADKTNNKKNKSKMWPATVRCHVFLAAVQIKEWC